MRCWTLLYFFRREIFACWNEPVLSRPVMIIESDDWGPGPEEQAEVLEEITSLLESFSDCDGRHPVMTLGMVLATADGGSIDGHGQYQRKRCPHSPTQDC